MTAGTIRIATRSSQLALWQANHVASLIRAAGSGTQVELVHVSTVGDRDHQSSLPQFGGVGVFTREIQHAVLDGRADLAVHSLKDLPTDTTAGLTLAAVPERGAVTDALVLPSATEGAGLSDLAEGARVGTGSLRRRAQLLHMRPDLQLLDVRGNVETRLRKLDDGDYDALVLAAAGLTRLGLAERITSTFSTPEFYPAVGQGALGLECREDDEHMLSLLGELDHQPTSAATAAERALLNNLRAGCHAPVGAAATIDDDRLTLAAVVLSADGRQRISASLTGPISAAQQVGRDVAADLRGQGADELIGST